VEKARRQEIRLVDDCKVTVEESRRPFGYLVRVGTEQRVRVAGIQVICVAFGHVAGQRKIGLGGRSSTPRLEGGLVAGRGCRGSGLRRSMGCRHWWPVAEWQTCHHEETRNYQVRDNAKRRMLLTLTTLRRVSSLYHIGTKTFCCPPECQTSRTATDSRWPGSRKPSWCSWTEVSSG
jgi:hypothetical protein